MLRTLAALALVLSVTAAHAEGVPANLPSTLDGRLKLTESLRDDRHSGVVMRNTGVVMSAVGTLASIAGAALLATTFCVDHCDGGSSALAIGGAAMLAVGQVSVIAGIPLWAAGQTRADRVERAMLSLSVSGARVTF